MENPFKEFKNEAFRLELLQQYIVPEEADMLRLFLETGELELPEDDEWLETIHNAKSRGASMKRVHVIEKPLSDYIRFELKAYEYNQRAGEDIFLLDHDDYLALNLGELNDFWLFDDEFVLNMVYAEDGTFTRSEPVVQSIKKYIDVRDALLAVSVPLNQYVDETLR